MSDLQMWIALFAVLCALFLVGRSLQRSDHSSGQGKKSFAVPQRALGEAAAAVPRETTGVRAEAWKQPAAARTPTVRAASAVDR